MLRRDLNIELYKKIFLIRKVEEKIREIYPEDDMKTPVHLSIGEEAIVSGVCQALRGGDQLFGSYRSHGLYLCRTGETDRFFAELYGKKTGLAGGKAGSMHLHAIEAGFLLASAVVGSQIPIAVGAAFANKINENGHVVAVFFGDGALEEGVFWESLNAACLKNIPILFVCEDNGLSIHTDLKSRQSFFSISKIASQFTPHVFQESTTDPEIIYELTASALDRIKTDQKPAFFHLNYYRYLEHVGVDEDFKFGYRSKEEYEEWLRKDPLRVQERKLLSLGISKEIISNIEKQIATDIERSVQKAKDAPFPEESELWTDIYA